jgi:hypothetical protein
MIIFFFIKRVLHRWFGQDWEFAAGDVIKRRMRY